VEHDAMEEAEKDAQTVESFVANDEIRRSAVSELRLSPGERLCLQVALDLAVIKNFTDAALRGFDRLRRAGLRLTEPGDNGRRRAVVDDATTKGKVLDELHIACQEEGMYCHKSIDALLRCIDVRVADASSDEGSGDEGSGEEGSGDEGSGSMAQAGPPAVPSAAGGHHHMPHAEPPAAAAAAMPTDATIRRVRGKIGDTCFEHIVTWSLLNRDPTVRARFGITKLPAAGRTGRDFSHVADIKTGAKSKHLFGMGLQVCRLTCSTLSCNPGIPRTGQDVPTHLRHLDTDATANQQNVDDILEAIEIELGDHGRHTVRSLAHIISDAGYAPFLDQLPSSHYCELTHIEQLYSDCDVSVDVLNHTIFRHEWSAENWQTLTRGQKSVKISTPIKALIIILAGNRCATCGTQLIPVGP